MGSFVFHGWIYLDIFVLSRIYCVTFTAVFVRMFWMIFATVFFLLSRQCAVHLKASIDFLSYAISLNPNRKHKFSFGMNFLYGPHAYTHAHRKVFILFFSLCVSNLENAHKIRRESTVGILHLKCFPIEYTHIRRINKTQNRYEESDTNENVG